MSRDEGRNPSVESSLQLTQVVPLGAIEPFLPSLQIFQSHHESLVVFRCLFDQFGHVARLSCLLHMAKTSVIEYRPGNRTWNLRRATKNFIRRITRIACLHLSGNLIEGIVLCGVFVD